MGIAIRPATRDDAPDLCTLLNTIIRIGGSTAHETELSETEFAEHFLNGPKFLCCFVALDGAGALAGFQAMDARPDNWADIGTFARAEPKLPGVGTALFEATRNRARELGVSTINATIRADNASGLAYYSKMGFVDYSVSAGVPLQDGTLVDRLSKRYSVTPVT